MLWKQEKKKKKEEKTCNKAAKKKLNKETEMANVHKFFAARDHAVILY